MSLNYSGEIRVKGNATVCHHNLCEVTDLEKYCQMDGKRCKMKLNWAWVHMKDGYSFTTVALQCNFKWTGTTSIAEHEWYKGRFHSIILCTSLFWQSDIPSEIFRSPHWFGLKAKIWNDLQSDKYYGCEDLVKRTNAWTDLQAGWF